MHKLMKRIFSLITLCLMAAVTLVSCSDDEKMNTGNATVAFKDAEFSVKESKGIFYIPIVVTGEQNGPIKLTIDGTLNDANCKEDQHFMITSKNIIIPENKKEVNIEIKAIDDRIINNDRHFSLCIVSADGASISSNGSSVNVTLLDNDNIPYERMAGTWVVEAQNLRSESGSDPISWEMNIGVLDDDDPSYGSVLNAAPWAVWDGSVPVFDEFGSTLTHQMTFYHNESTGKTTVDMKMGSIMASNLDFGVGQDGTDLSKASVRSATMGMAGLSFTGSITGVVSDSFDEITFNNPIYLVVFSNAGNAYMYYGGFDKITFKLKK